MSSLNIKRVIISVWNKENIVPFARTLQSKGVRIYSTGGTFRKLSEENITVEKIEELTGFPEIMGGRIKTLHPLIFSGILANSANPDHIDDLKKVNATAFQLVVVNLYPFSETYHAGGKSDEEIVEMIDIGGPSMLRAAAKNYKSVAVLSHPSQYDEFLKRFEAGEINENYRRTLARDVFIQTSNYDTDIATFFSEDKDPLPGLWLNHYQKSADLRYGENPDQQAALYNPQSDPKAQPFHQLQGKEISYNNYVDCIAAYRIAFEYKNELAVCVNIKHTNPCGFGLGQTPLDAYLRAVKADPVSYFGGIVGVNRPVDKALAEEWTKSFLECIVAPQFSTEALEILAKKKNLRLLIPNQNYLESKFDIKGYGKGLLVQEAQHGDDNEEKWEMVTEQKPQNQLYEALHLGWHLVKHVKSNAIVLVDQNGSIGVGAGQMSRVDALKIAIRKAEEAGLNIKNSIMASDAFFPFRDSIDLAVEYGVVGVIQPGGSVRDKEVIEACNEHGLFMLFTHKRVFKH